MEGWKEKPIQNSILFQNTVGTLAKEFDGWMCGGVIPFYLGASKNTPRLSKSTLKWIQKPLLFFVLVEKDILSNL